MTTIVNLPQDRLIKLSNLNTNFQDPFLAPTESNYFLFYPEALLQNLKIFAGNFLESFQIIHFFKNVDSLIKSLNPQTGVYLRLVISILKPGPIILALKDKQNRSFLAYIPSQPKLLEFFSKTETEWVGILPKTENNLPFISKEQLFEDVNFKNFPILDIQPNNLHNTLPTVLDCREENLIKIFQEGIVDSNEIKSLLPKNIEISTDIYPNFLSKVKLNKDSNRFRFLKETDLKSPEMTLVLGSKEELQKVFKFRSLSYFGYKQKDNFILFNLGSSAHQANLAKNLYKNLYESRKFGISKTLILDQNWGKSKYSKIIKQILNEVNLPVTSDFEPEYISSGILQEI